MEVPPRLRKFQKKLEYVMVYTERTFDPNTYRRACGILTGGIEILPPDL